MRFPTLYQINTRVALNELTGALGRPATLEDLPEALLEQIAGRGFSWLWLMGIWQTGPLGREISRHDPRVLASLERDLPGFRVEDISGSPFAVQAYDVHREFGDDRALARLRDRLARRGIRLLLDFVPNHVACDHPWVFDRPEYFIHGSANDLARSPQNYARVPTRDGPRIMAHGRDPNFDGWSDTLQLNHCHPGLREAQLGVLGRIAGRCDGVRCDMAMLLEPSVIQGTWGDRARPIDGTPATYAPFWTEAIAAIRRQHADFLFVAEAYWNLEWTLQEQGFDFTTDKPLYDRLRAGAAGPVRELLQATPAFRDRSLRFIENHDEPRAAALFAAAMHRAAAVVALFAPGLRLVHDGQIEGRRVHGSIHLARREAEAPDDGLRAFYDRLLAALARPEAHEGRWNLWRCRPAWDGNPTWDQFIVSTWDRDKTCLLVVVNYGPSQAQCTVPIGLSDLRGGRWMLVDLMSETRYECEGDELAGPGLILDLPGWGYQIFALHPV